MTMGTSSARTGLLVYRSIMWRRARMNGSPTAIRLPGSLVAPATVSPTRWPGSIGARMGTV